MSKKILLVYRINIESTNQSIGAIQKMYDKKKAFEHFGYTVDIVYLKNDGLYFNSERIYKESLSNIIYQYRFYHNKMYRVLWKHLTNKRYELCYFRYHLLFRQYIQFLKKLKEKCTRNIFLEIPTYPFDLEYNRFVDKIRIYEDRKHRKYLKKYTNRIVSYSSDKEIFGIPCIQIKNGIDLERYGMVKKIPSRDDTIRFIALGHLWNWFGLDRLLYGMEQHLRTEIGPRIRLSIVGAGPEGKNLSLLATKLGLKSNVIFYNLMYGDKLSDLFDQSDIGVGTLAGFRKQLHELSSLKHREYCLRGLPFFYAGFDASFKDDLSWAYRVPEDEEAINITEVLEHLHWKTHPKIIRSYAKEHLSWKSQIKLILDHVS